MLRGPIPLLGFKNVLFYGFDGFHDLGFQLFHQFDVIFQQGFDSIAPLSQFGIAIAKPGTGFFDDLIVDPQVDDLPHFGDALAIHDVKFCGTKRGCHFVFDHFDAGFVSHHFGVATFDLSRTADVQSNRGIEF